MSHRIALLLFMFLVGCSATTRGARPGTSRNMLNPLGRLFHDAATKHWGQLHPYTGD